MERLRRRTSGVLDIPREQEGTAPGEHGGAKDPDNEHPDHTRKLMAARCNRRRRSDDCGDDEVDLQPSHETRIVCSAVETEAPDRLASGDADPPTTASHADARGSAADGSYSDESAWIHQYAVTFPKSAVDFGQDVTLLVDGCTASRQCDRLRLPLCLGQKAAGPVLTYTDRENPCGPSTRAPLLR